MSKALISVVSLIFAFLSCNSQPQDQPQKEMFGLFKKQDAIERFWKWFVSTEKELHNFQTDPDRILTRVYDSVNKIADGLAIEFEPPQNNIVNVTISASGDKNLFPTVQAILEKAPKIEGWTFVAFRQRMPADKVKGMVLKAQRHELNPDKMKFLPIISGDKINITIYANDVTEENLEQVAYGCLLLVDNLLGEYDAATKIANYDVQDMPTKQEELARLKPLLGLAEYVDNFHAPK